MLKSAKFRSVPCAAAVVLSLMALPAAAQSAATGIGEAVRSPQGVWLDQNGRGAIEIAQCDAGLCGRLVWVKDAARVKSACGMQILGDVKPVNADAQTVTWDGGWIYSPELRSKFNVEIKPIDGDSLQVMGYAGTDKGMSQTMIWRRAPADLARCGETVRAGYLPAKVVVANAGGKPPVAVAVKAKPKAAKVAVKVERPRRVASSERHERSDRHERGHHSSSCNVRAPFVNVSFRCSAKASRVLARIF